MPGAVRAAALVFAESVSSPFDSRYSLDSVDLLLAFRGVGGWVGVVTEIPGTGLVYLQFGEF